ncbi:MAG: hypothetical protein U5M51_14100 [Emticicia sp.]|nr:hypothetical protein [Emticicia sp.]
MVYFIFLILIYGLNTFAQNPSTYKVTYKVEFISNLTNNSTRTETGFLIIKANQESVYATKNYYKRDSIRKLVSAGQN